MSQKEWDEFLADHPIGTAVEGRVTSVQPFGVFVDVGFDPRITVLLEIPHFKLLEEEPEHRIEFPDHYPQVGDRLSARILGFMGKSSQVRLTQLRQPSDTRGEIENTGETGS